MDLMWTMKIVHIFLHLQYPTVLNDTFLKKGDVSPDKFERFLKSGIPVYLKEKSRISHSFLL